MSSKGCSDVSPANSGARQLAPSARVLAIELRCTGEEMEALTKSAHCSSDSHWTTRNKSEVQILLLVCEFSLVIQYNGITYTECS